MTDVTGPPVETQGPCECPTNVWALLPESGRPVTLDFSMRDPGHAGEALRLWLNRVCGGGTSDYQAGMTCHIALTVTQRPPLPHTQAARRPLLNHRCRIHHTDNTRYVHHVHIRSRRITPPNKVLGDATPIEPASHHPEQPTTPAWAVPLSVHPGIAPHPLARPANRAESPSRHSTTIAHSGVAPIWLRATPYRRVPGTTHKVG